MGVNFQFRQRKTKLPKLRPHPNGDKFFWIGKGQTGFFPLYTDQGQDAVDGPQSTTTLFSVMRPLYIPRVYTVENSSGTPPNSNLMFLEEGFGFLKRNLL